MSFDIFWPTKIILRNNIKNNNNVFFDKKNNNNVKRTQCNLKNIFGKVIGMGYKVEMYKLM
jgi:hypothetical protein